MSTAQPLADRQERGGEPRRHGHRHAPAGRRGRRPRSSSGAAAPSTRPSRRRSPSGVVEPFMSGVGGIAFLVYRDAATGETVVLRRKLRPARGNPTRDVRAARPDRAERACTCGGRRGTTRTTPAGSSPAVPGMPALMQEAHRRYGRLPWRELLQPAIRLAADGFEVDFYVGMFIAANYERLHRCETSRRTFFKPSGAPLSPSTGFTPGDRLVQTDLARTLRLIAEEGADVVYRGEIARLIAEDMRRHGGLIAEADLAAHRTVVHDTGGAGHLSRLRDPRPAREQRLRDGGGGAEHPRGLRPRAGSAPSPSRPSTSSSRRSAAPSWIGCASSATPR